MPGLLNGGANRFRSSTVAPHVLSCSVTLEKKGTFVGEDHFFVGQPSKNRGTRVPLNN